MASSCWEAMPLKPHLIFEVQVIDGRGLQRAEPLGWNAAQRGSPRCSSYAWRGETIGFAGQTDRFVPGGRLAPRGSMQHRSPDLAGVQVATRHEANLSGFYRKA